MQQTAVLDCQWNVLTKNNETKISIIDAKHLQNAGIKQNRLQINLFQHEKEHFKYSIIFFLFNKRNIFSIYNFFS